MSVTGDVAGPFTVSGLDDGGLDRTLAHAGAGAFVIDADERIILWNQAAEEVMGYTPRELIGRRCRDVFGEQNGDGNRLRCRGCHTVRHAGHSELIQTFDLRTRTKAGKPVWINVGVLACHTDGARRSTIHVFSDVTESRTLLQRMHEQLARSDPADGAGASLTRRESEVLRLMTLGMNTAAAAKQLRVSPATIRNHVQNIFAKLGVHSRLEAVAYASRHRMF
jgi:PAS domain S-box-containing protein